MQGSPSSLWHSWWTTWKRVNVLYILPRQFHPHILFFVNFFFFPPILLSSSIQCNFFENSILLLHQIKSSSSFHLSLVVIKTWSVSQSEQRLISMCDYFYFLVGPPRLVTGNFINQSLSLSDYYFKFSSKNRKKDYYFKYCCWIALNFKDPIANPFNLVFAKAINVYVGQVTVFRKSKN